MQMFNLNIHEVIDKQGSGLSYVDTAQPNTLHVLFWEGA
jgi:hypothetical protein